MVSIKRRIEEQKQLNERDLWSNPGGSGLISNGMTAIKPFTMAEHQAVLAG